MDSASPRLGLGLGDLLMGRYRLDAELYSNLPDAQRFRATDKILSRQTEVHLLSGDRTDDVIDAARRAALVDDPRIVRIIDAGRYSGVCFVLTAPLDGVSLADVGPLPAAQARAVAGEVATALQEAAARDVHHLALRPELVFLGKGDTIRIGGMAWDAAARGIRDEEAATSSQADAKALVSILYAALTARWPGRTPSVMPTPPLWESNPVAPIELVSGVPGDLNTLCAVSLAADAVGPTTASQVVEDLGLWPTVKIRLPYSASVRGPIPRALTPPGPLPDPPELGADTTATPAEEEAEAEPESARTAPTGPAAPTGPTDADVAALASQAVIQDHLAAIEATVSPPIEADPPGYPDELVADVPDELRDSDDLGLDDDGELIWPTYPATPMPALSTLAEQLESVDPMAPPAGAEPEIARTEDTGPTEFALPPLPDDLADVLAAAPLEEPERPYEPVAVVDADEAEEAEGPDESEELDEDATLILDPVVGDEVQTDPGPRGRPPNRARPPEPSPLSTPVARDAAVDLLEAPPRPPNLFDVEPSSFDNVLADQTETSAPRRNWWAIAVFLVVVVACVAVGLVILGQVGILGLGVTLSPGLAPGGVV
ncbi:MAG: hypothetical protein LBK95_20380 [Bifidobacteriaceae bacterium]|jgi:hypothetical protein|nr:hypothetical protein [Bifidobacteriaceae bacterium]